MDLFNILSLLVGVIGVVIALVTLIRTRRFEEQAARPEIALSLRLHARKSFRIYAENVGGGVAKQLKLSATFQGGRQATMEQDRVAMPFKSVRPGESVSVFVDDDLSSAFPIDCKAEWQDVKGKKYECESTLTVG